MKDEPYYNLGGIDMSVYKNCDFDKINNKFVEGIYTEKCYCVYCINFFKEFPKKYKEALLLLEEFEVELEKPLEICYLGNDENEEDLHRYVAYYTIKGNLGQEKIIIKKEGLEVAFRSLMFNDEDYYEDKSEEKYFVMEINGILIPFEE